MIQSHYPVVRPQDPRRSQGYGTFEVVQWDQIENVAEPKTRAKKAAKAAEITETEE